MMNDGLTPLLEGGRDVPPRDWHDWKWQLRHRITTVTQLAPLHSLPAAGLSLYRRLIDRYPCGITPYYASLIDRADADDPIGRQCIPDPKEIDPSFGGEEDPFGEETGMPAAGVVHRYRDRCLLMVSDGCATYCRHCNRKRRWATPLPAPGGGKLEGMIAYISRRKEIREVILSGGDPLTLEDGLLDWFLGRLRALRHVDVLRIGSRIPVVMPMRVTKRLTGILHTHRPLWLNTQFNHPREITQESAGACEMLLAAGIPLSNQSVLLKGVNDRLDVMRELLYGLQRIGVRPYYLFHCDPVAGTTHFRADLKNGVEMMEKLRKTISGLCLPRYVLDTPGEMGKIPLGPGSIVGEGA